MQIRSTKHEMRNKRGNGRKDGGNGEGKTGEGRRDSVVPDSGVLGQCFGLRTSGSGLKRGPARVGETGPGGESARRARAARAIC